MPFAFLNPALLLGLLGAAVPIVVHLLGRRKAPRHKEGGVEPRKIGLIVADESLRKRLVGWAPREVRLHVLHVQKERLLARGA